MMSQSLNFMRALIGHHVNLHLKDGSVIVNVSIADVQRSNDDKGTAVYYMAPKKKIMKILTKDIEWAEKLNPHLIMNLQYASETRSLTLLEVLRA